MKLREIEHDGKLKLKGAGNPNDQALEGVEPPLPSHCFAMLLSGTPGSGKTSLLVSLLTSKHAYKRKFSRIYYFSPSMSTLPETFTSKLHPGRVFSSLDALPDVLKEIGDLKETGEKALIVIDDLVKELNGDYKKEVLNLLNNRRHQGGGVCVALVTQKLRSVPLAIRNACDSVFFFSLKNRREINDLFDDCISSFLSRVEFETVVKHCTGEPYCFLYTNIRAGKLYKRFNELRFEEDEE